MQTSKIGSEYSIKSITEICRTKGQTTVLFEVLLFIQVSLRMKWVDLQQGKWREGARVHLFSPILLTPIHSKVLKIDPHIPFCNYWGRLNKLYKRTEYLKSRDSLFLPVLFKALTYMLDSSHFFGSDFCADLFCVICISLSPLISVFFSFITYIKNLFKFCLRLHSSSIIKIKIQLPWCKHMCCFPLILVLQIVLHCQRTTAAFFIYHFNQFPVKTQRRQIHLILSSTIRRET